MVIPLQAADAASLSNAPELPIEDDPPTGDPGSVNGQSPDRQAVIGPAHTERHPDSPVAQYSGHRGPSSVKEEPGGRCDSERRNTLRGDRPTRVGTTPRVPRSQEHGYRVPVMQAGAARSGTPAPWKGSSNWHRVPRRGDTGSRNCPSILPRGNSGPGSGARSSRIAREGSNSTFRRGSTDGIDRRGGHGWGLSQNPSDGPRGRGAPPPPMNHRNTITESLDCS